MSISSPLRLAGSRGSRDVVTVDFDFMGETTRLALVAEHYADGGLAILLLDATDPEAEEHMSEWGVLTAGVPGAENRCREPGRITVDVNGNPAALLDTLVDAWIMEVT